MEIIIGTLLILYIGYLHYQLYKKNIFIDSVVKKLTEAEKTWSKEYLIELLKDVQHLKSFEHIKEHKLLAENSMNFIFEEENNRAIFIHYTKNEDIAKRILKNGFQFVESFYKTAERVTSDKLDLVYKHSLHKHYGKMVIVICISKHTFDYYTKKIISSGGKNVQVEQILTEVQPCLNENQDQIYTLPNQFIKGYLNYETGEIVYNSQFNANYHPMIFDENLMKMSR